MQSLPIFAPKGREDLNAQHSSSRLPLVSSVPPPVLWVPPPRHSPVTCAGPAESERAAGGTWPGTCPGNSEQWAWPSSLPSAPLPAPGALQDTLIVSMSHVRFSSSLVRPRARARPVHTEVCRPRAPADAAGTHHCRVRRPSQPPCRGFRCGFCWRKGNPSSHGSKGTLSVHTEARGMGGRECLSWGRRC